MKLSRFTPYIAFGLIASGTVLRLRQYLAVRSLWLDEAMLALNIIHKDVIGLLGSLEYNQGAPLGFLLVEKIVTSLLGINELRLRLFPLISGIISIVIFYMVLKNVLNTAGVLAALALFAYSPTLIYYSSEVKQYSLDVLMIVFLLWLFINMQKQQSQVLYQVFLVISAALVIWFSHPSVFMLASIGVVLFLQVVLKKNNRSTLPIWVIGAIWFLSVGILYFINLKGLSENEFLLNYWGDSFLPVPIEWHWIKDAFLNLFTDVAGLDSYFGVFLILVLLGLTRLYTAHWTIAGSITLTFVFVLIASGLQKYPFSGRLMLFSVPLLFMLIGAGLDFLLDIPSPSKVLNSMVAVCLIGLILIAPVSTSIERYKSPPDTDYIRPAMEYLMENYLSGDVIYVYYWTVPAFEYYSLIYDFSGKNVVVGKQPEKEEIISELSQLNEHERIWIIFSHLSPKRKVRINDLLVHMTSNMGTMDDKFIVPGSGVYLYMYDLSNK